jgi:hypothetical protein
MIGAQFILAKCKELNKGVQGLGEDLLVSFTFTGIVFFV